MKLEPYTIPEADADLWHTGRVVTLELPNGGKLCTRCNAGFKPKSRKARNSWCPSCCAERVAVLQASREKEEADRARERKYAEEQKEREKRTRLDEVWAAHPDNPDNTLRQEWDPDRESFAAWLKRRRATR